MNRIRVPALWSPNLRATGSFYTRSLLGVADMAACIRRCEKHLRIFAVSGFISCAATTRPK